MFDCWTAAEEGVLTQDRVHDLTDISKQEQFFQGTCFMDCLLSQLLVKYKGDADLLNYFHTIDAQGQDTGMLLDLIEPVENSLINGFDPSAGFRFKTTNTNTACADVSASGPAGSQPSGLLANSDMLGTQIASPAQQAPASGGTQIADHQQDKWQFDPCAPAAASPAHIALPPGVAPTGPPQRATRAFASRQYDLQTTLSWDATEARGEEELSVADNLMAVHNSMQAADAQSPTLAPPQPTYKAPPANAPPPTPAELAANQLADARQLADAGHPVGWCAAAQMQPCTPSPPPSKAPPGQAPPGLSSVDVDAEALLAQVQGVGASPEVMALLYAATGLTPPPAARPKASPPPLNPQGDAAASME